MTECLSNAELERYHARDMAAASIDRVRIHLEQCTTCAHRNRALVDAHGDMVADLQGLTISSADTRTDDGSRIGTATPLPWTLPGYDIVRELKRGGQGVVYQAVQQATKSKVAIKVLLDGIHASKSARRRFEREIEIVAQLKHPNIVAIFDSGVSPDGLPYYVMEYIRGVPLTDWVRGHKPPLEDALGIFSTVCQAVNFAHRRGVIHRDLKPSNIMVDTAGRPKVLDFGLARRMAGPIETIVSVTQAVIGTLPYMSPEQTRGNPDEIDIRTDVYALGVILYELLTGHYPYPVAGQMAEVLRHITSTPPTPPSRQWTRDSGVQRGTIRRLRSGGCPIDDEVQTIVLKALAKEPDRRYQSAGEFARDVSHYLAGEAIEAKRDSGWYRLRCSVRRHRARYFMAACLTLLMAAAGVAGMHSIQTRRVEEVITNGMSDLATSRFDRGLARIEQALIADPDHARAQFAKAWGLRLLYLWRRPYGDRTDIPEARALCESAARTRRRPGVLNLLGTLCYLDDDTEAAVVAFEEALALDPDYFFAASNLAKAKALGRDLAGARAAVARGLEAAACLAEEEPINHADGIWLTLGTLELAGGDPEALATLQRAVELDPEDHRNRLMLARALLNESFLDPAAALEHAKAAELLNLRAVNDPRIDRVLALAYLAGERYEDAAHHAEKAREGGDVPAINLLIRAICFAHLQEMIAAREALHHAQDDAPRFDAGLLVNAEKEVLWIDGEDDYTALLDRARRAVGE